MPVHTARDEVDTHSGHLPEVGSADGGHHPEPAPVPRDGGIELERPLSAEGVTGIQGIRRQEFGDGRHVRHRQPVIVVGTQTHDRPADRVFVLIGETQAHRPSVGVDERTIDPQVGRGRLAADHPGRGIHP